MERRTLYHDGPGRRIRKHPEVQLLLQQYGYNIRPTAPDASYQNAPDEKPYQTIANAIRTMLEGANLPEKYWRYVLYHYTDIHRYVIHRGRDKTPYKIMTSKRPNLSKLCTFGCRVSVFPPGRRKHKLDNHVNKGIFLCYTATMKYMVFQFKNKQSENCNTC